MKKKPILIIIAAFVIAYIGDRPEFADLMNQGASTETFNDSITSAYENRQSDKILTAAGTVAKLLKDDNKGSRHQKFIVQITPTLSILIAHNIDLAPRINSIKVGEEVEFKGEYEWNKKGGVVHWTHHDPRGSHPGGWIKYRGKLYQ